MDLNIFNKSNTSKNVAGTFSDTSKVQEITEKLCAKRKLLEEKIKSSQDVEKDTYALELLDLENSMRTFGISEIDYHIYLAKQQETL